MARDGGAPNSAMVPPEAGSRPSSIRISVVLPAPLAPSRPTISPGPTRRLTSRTAVKWPNRRVTAAHSASGAPPAGPAPSATSRGGALGRAAGPGPGWGSLARAATVTAS